MKAIGAIILLFCLLHLQANASNTTSATNKSDAITKTTVTNDIDIETYLNYTRSGLSSQCVELMQKADSCVKDALFIGASIDEVLMPTSEKELDIYCGKTKAMLDCLKEYRICLKPFPKTLFGVVVRDARIVLKNVCSPANKKETLGHFKCFQKENLERYHHMMHGYTNVVVHLTRPNVHVEALIGSACCAFQVLAKDSKEMVGKLCNPLTGMQTGEFVVNLVRSFMNSALDISCGKHKSIEVCTELMAQEVALYKQLMMQGMRKEFPFSPITPMIQILNILDTQVNL